MLHELQQYDESKLLGGIWSPSICAEKMDSENCTDIVKDLQNFFGWRKNSKLTKMKTSL